MKKIAFEKRIRRLEHLIYESEGDNIIDCELLLQTVKDYLDDLPEVDIYIDDDNLENGWVNVSFYNPIFITDYEVLLDEDEGTLAVSKDGQTVGEAEDAGEAGEMIADHFMGEYMQY